MVHFTQPFQLRGSRGSLEIKHSKPQAPTARLLLGYIDPIREREPSYFDPAYGFPLPSNGALIPLPEVVGVHGRILHEIALFDALAKTGGTKNLRVKMWVGANLLVEIFLTHDKRSFVLTQFEDQRAPGSRQARFALTPSEEARFMACLLEVSELTGAFAVFLESGAGEPPQTIFEPDISSEQGYKPAAKRRSKKETFTESPLPAWPVKITSGEDGE